MNKVVEKISNGYKDIEKGRTHKKIGLGMRRTHNVIRQTKTKFALVEVKV